jgi:peptidoglycan-associated lipoprotein
MMPVFVAFALVSTLGCSQSKPKEEASPQADIAEALGDSDHGNPYGLKSAHFDYKSAVLTSEAQGVLESDAKILAANPTLTIQIEGHGDQRGARTLNFVLGEKRSGAARDFLVKNGIKKSRISTISYGNDKLLDTGTDEAAMRRNRRANLVILSK